MVINKYEPVIEVPRKLKQSPDNQSEEPIKQLKDMTVTELLTDDYVGFTGEEPMSMTRRIRELINEEATPSKLREIFL